MLLPLFNHRRFNSIGNIKKLLMELHTVFLSVICHIHQWKYRQNKVDIFFVWRSFSVYKSIGDYIIDGMSDRTIITEESFSDEK